MADERCKFDDCGRLSFRRGWCKSHYDQIRAGQLPQPLRPWRIDWSTIKVARRCIFEGCARPHHSRGLCVSHAYQRDHGDGVLRPIGAAREPAWFVNKDGYRQRTVRGKTELEHRSVMERVIGRLLLPEETVHHKNGNRSDNRESNLELWSTSQPKGQRIEDKVAWALEILALYGAVTEAVA